MLQGEVTSDFQQGVDKVLVSKQPGRPEWSPSTVSEVTKETVEKFFDPSSTYQLDIPDTLQVPSASRYFDYALPTEEEIGSAVMGSHANAGDMGATAEEIIALFEGLRPGKQGVREKVQEVLQRRCTLVDNADGNFVWLKWIHN